MLRVSSLFKRLLLIRTDLLNAAVRDALFKLEEVMRNPPNGAQTYENLERMGHLYRKFAKKNRRTLALIFTEALIDVAHSGSG